MRHLALSLVLLAVVACQSPAPSPAPPPLRVLDAAHAAEFRAAFDDAKDRPRFVVALSPT